MELMEPFWSIPIKNFFFSVSAKEGEKNHVTKKTVLADILLLNIR